MVKRMKTKIYGEKDYTVFSSLLKLKPLKENQLYTLL